MAKAQYENYVNDEKALRKFVKHMVKNQVFVGSYIEQRYVSTLGTYMKIIKISKDEDVFIENLSVVKRRLEKFYNGSKWIGITFPDTPGAPVGFNLWTNVEEEIFGEYKFLVKDISFGTSVVLKLQALQECESSLNQTEVNLKNCSELLTWENFKNSVSFIFILITAIVTGGGQILMFSMNFFLKFMKEFNNFITASTPMFIACLDTISRIFGYICFLIALLWNGKKDPMNYHPPEPRRYIPIQSYENRYKSLEYRPRSPRSSVKIREIIE